MEVFTLDETSNYSDGTPVQGIDSLVWVEKYREAGEFTIIGDPSAQFFASLPLDALISHSDTAEVMMVENHEIDETKDGSPKLVVTGRSVEAVMMENRVITLAFYLGYKDGETNFDLSYYLLAEHASNQARTLIYDFLEDSIVDAQENLPNFHIFDMALNPPGTPDLNRVIKPGYLYPEVLALLASVDNGIKTMRPSPGLDYMSWWIHNGLDKTSSVQFDWVRGEVENARYLWSTKNKKTLAYIKAQYYGSLSGTDFYDGWARRNLFVDMGDYTDYFGPDPAPITLDNILRMLIARGDNEMAKYTGAVIMDATIAENAKLRYRQHYNIGDIVYVIGNYGVASRMRVTEYAETMDEKGERGFPTLKALYNPLD